MNLTRHTPRTAVAVSALAVAIFGLSACSGDEDSSPAKADAEASESTAPVKKDSKPPVTDADGEPLEATDVEADEDGLVGPDCERFAKVEGADAIEGQTLAQFVSSNPAATGFRDLATGKTNPKADISAALNEGGKTLFVPTNESVQAIAGSALKNFAKNNGLLADIVEYHVATGLIAPADLASGDPMKTLQGSPLAAVKAPYGVSIDTAPLACGGYEALDGAVYFVKTLMLPPAS